MFERTGCDRRRPTTISDEISLAYPNLKQSIWLIVLFAFSQLILAGLADILGLWQPEDGFLSGIALLVGFAVIVGYVYRRTDLDWKNLWQLFNTGFNWRIWPCVAFSIVGLLLFFVGLILFLTHIFPIAELLQDSDSTEIGNGASFLAALFCLVVIGPLVEEILFRGIILHGLLAHRTRTRAIVWSAFLFGVYHLEMSKLVPTMLFGLVWGWWVVRTGSLLPALFGHALNNLISVVARYSDIPEGSASEDIGDLAFVGWCICFAGAALTALGLWWFYRVSNETQHISEGRDPPADAEANAG